jgi:hypothetical protein
MVDLTGHQWTKIQKSQAHKAYQSPSEQGSKNGLRGLQLSPISTMHKARSKRINELLALFYGYRSQNAPLSMMGLRAQVRAKHEYPNSRTSFLHLSFLEWEPSVKRGKTS